MAHRSHTGEEEKKEEADDNSDCNDGQQQKREGNGETDNAAVDSPQRTGVAEGNNTCDNRNSSGTRVGSGDVQRNEVGGVKVDPEKGRDASIVTWFDKNDPEVRDCAADSRNLLLTRYYRILKIGQQAKNSSSLA